MTLLQFLSEMALESISFPSYCRCDRLDSCHACLCSCAGLLTGLLLLPRLLPTSVFTRLQGHVLHELQCHIHRVQYSASLLVYLFIDYLSTLSLEHKQGLSIFKRFYLSIFREKGRERERERERETSMCKRNIN